MKDGIHIVGHKYPEPGRKYYFVEKNTGIDADSAFYAAWDGKFTSQQIFYYDHLLITTTIGWRPHMLKDDEAFGKLGLAQCDKF